MSDESPVNRNQINQPLNQELNPSIPKVNPELKQIISLKHISLGFLGIFAIALIMVIAFGWWRKLPIPFGQKPIPQVMVGEPNQLGGITVSNYPGVILTDRLTKTTLSYYFNSSNGAVDLTELNFWLDEEAPTATHLGLSLHGQIKKVGSQYYYFGQRYTGGTQSCGSNCSGTCCYLNYTWDVGGEAVGSANFLYLYADFIDRTTSNFSSSQLIAQWRPLTVQVNGRYLALTIEYRLFDYFQGKNGYFFVGAKGVNSLQTNPFWQKVSEVVYWRKNLAAVANRDSLPLYDTFELGFDGLLSANPYDPNLVDGWTEFISPSGKQYRQPAFAYTEFSRSAGPVVAQSNPANGYIWNPGKGPAEILTPGRKHWQVRFSPDEVGSWKYQLKMKDAAGEVVLPQQNFSVTASNHRGPMRISAKDPDYFEDARGNFFLGIGTNNSCLMSECNPTQNNLGQGTYIFEQQMDEMVQNGMNVLRLGPGENWGFSFEWRQSGLGDYDGRQAQAWALDHVIDYAKQKDIYLIPVFEWQGVITSNEGGTFNEWISNPYNSQNGGPIPAGYPEQFWANPVAKELYKRKLRYLSARYFYNPNILMYEIWSEYSVNNQWFLEMKQYLEDITVPPHRHPVAISDYHGPDQIQQTNFSNTDIVSWHYYQSYQPINSGTEDLYNKIVSLQNYQKPVFLGESGLVPSEGNNGKLALEGKHLHQTLWISLMAKNLLTALPWYWWEIHNQGRYVSFKALAEFIQGEDLRGMAAIRPTFTTSQLQAYGLKDENKILVWMVNQASDWVQAMKNRRPSPTSGTLRISNVENGNYTVHFFDPYKYTPYTYPNLPSDQTITVANQELAINLPEITYDLALKISYSSSPPPSPSSSPSPSPSPLSSPSPSPSPSSSPSPSHSPSPSPSPVACSEDVNRDGQVSINDLLSILSKWGACSGCREDINHDGQVNITDLMRILAKWGSC